MFLIWTKSVWQWNIWLWRLCKKVPFPLFKIIMQNVKERIQINRTACWMSLKFGDIQWIGINSYAICHGILEDFVQLHINVISIIWQNFRNSVINSFFLIFYFFRSNTLCGWRMLSHSSSLDAFFIGLRSGNEDGHVINFSLLNPTFARYSTVERAACDGALSCMKIASSSWMLGVCCGTKE